MAKFPVDAPIEKVIQTLEKLGFHIVRRGNHIAMLRQNADGSAIPLTLPNHRRLKSSTLRTILSHARIAKDDFLNVYENT